MPAIGDTRVRTTRDAEPSQDRQRSRVQGVAAQLVAREPRPIEQTDTHARPRQHNRRERTRPGPAPQIST